MSLQVEAVHPISSTQVAARVVIVDDHPVLRRGLAALIDGEADLEVCGEAESYEAGLRLAREHQPEVIVLDISLPDASGIELVKVIKTEFPRTAILVVSVHEESKYALRAFQAGAQGYIMKADAASAILGGIRNVLAGKLHVSKRLGETLTFRAMLDPAQNAVPPEKRLTSRERDVLALMGKGLDTRGIAEALKMSPKTVDTHRVHMKEKLGLQETSELRRFACDLEIRQHSS